MNAYPAARVPLAATTVSVLLPVLNEADHIDEVLASLAAQDHPGSLQVVVADGGSTDGTLERLSGWRDRLDDLIVVHNAGRVQAHGLNLAARAATGQVLVRADGHTVYAADYVRRSVEALLGSGAVAVGGNLRPEGSTPFGRAVARVMTSPLAIGPGRFHHATRRQPADTVYLGAFRREDLLASGGYRALPSGVAEDADLYHRWRRQGRTVLLDPAIRSTYRPRETPRAFARQSWRYGAGKGELLWVNGRWPSWRPLAPLALVTCLAGGGLVAAAGGPRWPLTAVTGVWVGGVAVVGARQGDGARGRLLVAGAMAIMHLSYGVGLVAGLLRGPRRLRGLRDPSRRPLDHRSEATP
ncbi:MAG TPA: glycosyltransferase family 2 protein [Nitriliruptorales bacterium]|nr:glycosyltransferase family 2 protein [Nitriliruptorales bacterium]